MEDKPIVNITATHISEPNRDEYIQYKIDCLKRNANKNKSIRNCQLKKINIYDDDYDKLKNEYNYFHKNWINYKTGNYELIIS